VGINDKSIIRASIQSVDPIFFLTLILRAQYDIHAIAFWHYCETCFLNHTQQRRYKFRDLVSSSSANANASSAVFEGDRPNGDGIASLSRRAGN
jgi:hypothetical protein